MRISLVINTIVKGGGKEYIERYLRFKSGRLRWPWALNMLTTETCNSRCKICYEYKRIKFLWAQYNKGQKPEDKISLEEFMKLLRKEELSNEEFRKILQMYKNAGVTTVTLTGGEPLLSPNKVRIAFEIFGSGCIVISNAIKPIPDYLETRVFASIHHPDPAINDAMSGRIGTTALQDEHIKGRKNIVVSMVLNHDNVTGIEAMVEKVRTLGVRGIVFSGYTPSRRKPGDAPDPLMLTERDIIYAVSKLMKVWEQNKDIVLMTPEIIKLFYSKSHQKGCSIREGSRGKGTVLSLDASGKPIKQCVMGENADCNECLCIIPMYMEGLKWAIPMAIARLDPDIIVRIVKWVKDVFVYEPPSENQ